MLIVKRTDAVDVALALVMPGDENEPEFMSLDHVGTLPSDFLNPEASAIRHEEETTVPLALEHVMQQSIPAYSYVTDADVAYRPYSAEEFKLRSSLLVTL